MTQIKNNDNLCCPRAIVTALTYHTDYIFGSKRGVKHIREGRNVQTILAKELCRRLGDHNEEGFTLKDIKHVELLNIQIKVVCVENFNTIIYSGEERETKIWLYKNGKHFDVINAMKAFLGCSYYCYKCDKPYNNKNRHQCRNARTNFCKLCARSSHSQTEKSKIYCENCDRYCFNQNCFDSHNDVCEEVYKYKDCNKIKLRSEKHICGFIRCSNCVNIVEEASLKMLYAT